MRIIAAVILSLIALLPAKADILNISGLGNGQGWSDGSYYTGFLTVHMHGEEYRGLCIDSMHETFGDSWDAVYVPLTDTAVVADVVSQYFSLSDSAVYLPKLYTGMAGYTMLSAVGTDRNANNAIQHAVWSQFDPAHYPDPLTLSSYASLYPPFDLTQFGLIVDANYARGGRLEQMFLVDELPLAEQNFFVTGQTPEPASVQLIGGGLIGFLLLIRRLQRR